MKEKKQKKQSSSKWKELWENPRTHALMVLGLWAVFFIFVFLYVEIASSFSPRNELNEAVKQEEVKEKKFLNAFQKLSQENYAFTLLKASNSYWIINGRRMDDLEEGFLEDENGIIKYMIQSEKMYQLEINNSHEIPSFYEGLPESVKSIRFVYNLLENMNFVIEGEHATYQVGSEVYTFSFDGEKITNLVYTTLEDAYTYTFTSIGEVKITQGNFS